MSFLINLGYAFKLASHIQPQGGVLQSSSLMFESLIRRQLKKQHHHLRNYLLFDPQLYLSGLDANQSPNPCTKLATYPWFGISGISEYDSGLQRQRDWKRELESNITNLWSRTIPNEPEDIASAVESCIDFQNRINCDAIILPSPLTVDPSTDYSAELLWLDSALDYIAANEIETPVYATVALSDICVRYAEPLSNSLLHLILDAVSARDVDGVYLVIEQSSETSETRHFSDTRSLSSALHMVYTLTQDCGLRVGVNYFGFYGLALEAAGAEFWASGWYKSVYRLRLADKLSGGRAFPSFWAFKAAADIHLDGDFDVLRKAGIIKQIAIPTSASEGLLRATEQGACVANIPSWEYRQSNITAAQEHYLLAAIQEEANLSACHSEKRFDYIETWLQNAVLHNQNINKTLGPNSYTKTDYVKSWLDAFQRFRRDHNV